MEGSEGFSRKERLKKKNLKKKQKEEPQLADERQVTPVDECGHEGAGGG